MTAQNASGASEFNELLLLHGMVVRLMMKKSMSIQEIPVALKQESHYRFFYWDRMRGVVAWWRGIADEHNKVPHR